MMSVDPGYIVVSHRQQVSHGCYYQISY